MNKSLNKVCVTCGNEHADHHSHECPLHKQGGVLENYFTRMTRLRQEGASHDKKPPKDEKRK